MSYDLDSKMEELKALFPEHRVRHTTEGNGCINIMLERRPIIKETIPEEGTTKYYVTYNRLNVYTAMGADNPSHAANKATKLWGSEWTSLGKTKPTKMEFVTVPEFGKIMKDAGQGNLFHPVTHKRL